MEEEIQKLNRKIDTLASIVYNHKHKQYDQTQSLPLASSTEDGLVPTSPADATKFLNGAATPAFAQVKDSDLSTSDITTNNATTSKHGFLKKLSNVATEFLDGTGVFSTPTGNPLTYTVNADESVSTYSTYPILFIGTGLTGLVLSNCTGGAGGGGGYAVITSSGAWSVSDSLPGSGSNQVYVPDSKTIRLKFKLRFTATTNRRGFGIAGAAASIAVVQTDADSAVRFVENAGTLYAQNANGAAATATDVSSGITRTNWNLYEIVFIPGGSAKFYINGTLVATHTTNLPSTGNYVFSIGGSTTTQVIETQPVIISIQN